MDIGFNIVSYQQIQYKGDIDKTVHNIFQILSINLLFSILNVSIAGLCKAECLLAS